MNFLRNFAYVRVKIGCQDPALVPSSRIGTIKKGFYEFQFTREVIDPSSTPANYYAATIENNDGGTQQSSPKRQRTGREEERSATCNVGNENTSTIGGGSSQTNQQRASNSEVEKGNNVVVSSSSISDELSESFATKVNRAMGITASADGNATSSSANADRIPTPSDSVPLQEVHRDVVNALVQELPVINSKIPVPDNNESFKKFLDTLTKNGSDKVYMHQKTYQKAMEPIIEDQEMPAPEHQGGDDDNLDMVDYKSSGDEAVEQGEEEEGEFVQGVIMGLVAPSLEHERTAVVIPMDGPQPELEQMQDEMQESLTQEEHMAINSKVQVEQPIRASSRIAGMPTTTNRTEDGTRLHNQAGSIPGTNLNSVNSFAVLDDEDICARALEMGVVPGSFNLEKINHIKALEVARHNLAEKIIKKVNDKESESDTVGTHTLFLGFGEEDMDYEGYTPFLSKKTKKRMKSACKIQRSLEKNRQKRVEVGAQSGLCAAQEKVINDHPVCGIVTGSRIRRKNPKYL
jgi:hypothetical protein